MQEFRLKIAKMSCAGCAASIERSVSALPGVLGASVSFVSSAAVFVLGEVAPSHAQIDPQATKKKIIEKIRSLGFEILEDEEALENFRKKERKTLLINLILSFVLAGLCMGLEMFFISLPAPSSATTPATHLAATAHSTATSATTATANLATQPAAVLAFILALIGIFYCGRGFFAHALAAAKNFNADMNTLISLGLLSALVYSGLVFAGVFAGEPYLGGGLMIIAFVLLGKFLESQAMQRANAYHAGLSRRRVESSTLLLPGGGTRQIPSSLIRAGDELLLREGEGVGADCVVLTGWAEVDMSFLTGEFLPVAKGPGEELAAGAIIITGSLQARATKKAMDSSLEQLKGLICASASAKLPSLADRILGYFVGALILFALCVFGLWAWWVGPGAGLLHACAVLLISCPCALGLAAPIARIVALGEAAKKLVLVKDPAALEALAGLRLALFDKTGSLTSERLGLAAHNLAEADLAKLAQLAAASSHPAARAIVEFVATSLAATSSPLPSSAQILIGKGLRYAEGGEVFLAGSEKLMQENGVDLAGTEDFLRAQREGHSLVFFAKNGLCLGVVALENFLRPGAAGLIVALKRRGVRSVILSGDNEKSVACLASKLAAAGGEKGGEKGGWAGGKKPGEKAGEAGVKKLGGEFVSFHAGLSPEEKLAFIKNSPPALFVGDGINDAPALAAAAVGVSLASASQLAQKQGELILLGEDLGALGFCFELSLRLRRIIRMNYFWAFFYNLLCLPIAAGFVPGIFLSPQLAAAAMCASSLCVVGNSLRLKKFSCGDIVKTEQGGRGPTPSAARQNA